MYWYLLVPTSNAAVTLFWQVLSGWALTSASVFAAACFSKPQISGISVVIIFLVMAFGAMLLNTPGSGAKMPGIGTQAPLSLLFPSMNFMFMVAYYCRYEMQGLPIDLLKAPPSTQAQQVTSALPAVAIWIFLIVQIVGYPILAVVLEQRVHGISFARRTFSPSATEAGQTVALQTSGLSKTYLAPWHKRLFSCGGQSSRVLALQGLDLVTQKRQILCLLGANGSWKTTTLDLIAVIRAPTDGSVTINTAASQLGESSLTF